MAEAGALETAREWLAAQGWAELEGRRYDVKLSDGVQPPGFVCVDIACTGYDEPEPDRAMSAFGFNPPLRLSLLCLCLSFHDLHHQLR